MKPSTRNCCDTFALTTLAATATRRACGLRGGRPTFDKWAKCWNGLRGKNGTTYRNC